MKRTTPSNSGNTRTYTTCDECDYGWLPEHLTAEWVVSYRVLSLYSGVGSMDRALPEGYEVAAFCESAAYPRKVLALRHPGIPIYESDEEVTSERLTRDGIGPIHMVIGGPPCQEFSMAGKRLGAAGAHNRFPEYLRIVRELRPLWCVAENVAGLRVADQGRYLAAVVWELADMGYRVGWGHWRAADAGAPHRRERIFIVGRLGNSGELVARGAWQHQPGDVDRPTGRAGG